MGGSKGVLTAIFLIGSALLSPSGAQESYRIGASLGLSGYATNNDRAWRDGMQLAIDKINAGGGLLGRKIELFAEDNRSEPQEAVVGYRKMLSSDKVQIFDSGCVSAGNFAAAGASARAEVPMFLCSILPDRPQERKWTFTNLSPPRFDLEARFRYLQEKTEIRKVGVLHDPTPYANMTKSLAETMAQQFGLTVVAVEAYKADDPDLSIQIGRIKAAGGEAIIKIGLGGSTIVAAKNITQLGFDRMILFAAIDDGSIFRPSGELLGERFLFVATTAQVPDSVPAGPARAPLDEFLKAWRGKYGDRDPVAGARAWDSVSIIAKAAEIGGSTDGATMRDSLEKVSDFQGVMTKYHFSPDQHYGVTQNPFVIGVVRNGNFAVK